jgi:Flp pilus assembly protein TadG
MTLHPRHKAQRGGATAVEFAFIALIFLMMLFGILEYGRLVYTQNILNNAAREGARFCITNINSATNAQAHTYVNNYLAGCGSQLAGWNPAPGGNISIYGAADPNGRWVAGADGSWTNSTFGGKLGPPLYYAAVGVTISGTYNPVLPNFLFMSSSLTLNGTAIMYVEAN